MASLEKLKEIRKKEWEETKDIQNDYNVRKYIWSKIAASGELFKEILKHPHLLIELQFTIVNKKFKEVPFLLNKTQESLMNDYIVPMLEKQKKGELDQIKIKVLKGRQQGGN